MGRPSLPMSQHRVQVSTTIPLPLKENIDKRQWKLNELLHDGSTHREECQDLLVTIKKLSDKIISLTEDNERLRTGL